MMHSADTSWKTTSDYTVEGEFKTDYVRMYAHGPVASICQFNDIEFDISLNNSCKLPSLISVYLSIKIQVIDNGVG